MKRPPKTIKDVPKRYLMPYRIERDWVALDDKKMKHWRGKLSFRSMFLDHSGLSKKQEKVFERRRPSVFTATDGQYSRVLLLADNEYIISFIRESKSGTKSKLSTLADYILIFTDPVSTTTCSGHFLHLEGHLPNLDEWFGQDILDFDYQRGQFNTPQRVYDSITVKLDFVEVKITFQSGLAVHERYDRFEAKPESFVKIDFLRGIAIDDINYAVGLFRSIEYFFDFIFSASYATNIFYSSVKKSRQSPSTLYVLDRSPAKQKSSRGEPQGIIPRALFHRDGIPNFEVFLGNWCRGWWDDSRHIRNIVDTLHIIRLQDLSWEVKFVAAVNALEASHELLGSVDSVGEESLADQSAEKFDSNASLRRKLRNILKTGKDYGLHKMSNKLVEKTVHNTVEIRNQLTHGPREFGQKVQGREIHLGMNQVNALLADHLKAIILKSLGTSDDTLGIICSKMPSRGIGQYLIHSWSF